MGTAKGACVITTEPIITQEGLEILKLKPGVRQNHINDNGYKTETVPIRWLNEEAWNPTHPRLTEKWYYATWTVCKLGVFVTPRSS